MVFFVKFIYAVLPSAFILGLLKSHYNNNQNIYPLSIFSFLLGICIQFLFMNALYDNEFLILTSSVLIVLNIFFLISFLFFKHNFIYYIFSSILFLHSGALFNFWIHDLPFTTTSVINSDLVIHSSFVLLAIFFVFYMFYAAYIFSKDSCPHLFRFALIVSLITSIIVNLGTILRYAIKNDIFEVTPLRISITAKISHYSFLDIYIYMFFLVFFIFMFFKHRVKFCVCDTNSEQRKLLNIINIQKRLLLSGAFSIVFVLSLVSYYDFVASKPPVLSPSVVLQPNENGKIILDTKNYLDGDLYRFAYITNDGKKVRFFAINRYLDKNKVVVVYDACMICGDLGYIKEDNQVICLACNVRVFIPSIGQAGGCNPIPIEYKQEGDFIIIDKSTLETGSTYFSEVVEKEVIDIISGAKLINTKAKYSYGFRGQTYFFESEENLEKFREDPEKYASDAPRPRWRSEGHKESK